VTGLIEAPDANTAQTAVVPPVDGDRPLEWAPHEPAPKRHRVGLWVGVAVGVLVLGAAAASTILIAPGTTIAGVPVGGLTPGAAADVVNAHLADTEITLTGAGEDQVVTAADLGASLDARALADEAYASHPMWNLGAWMPEPIAGDITLDTDLAHDTLRELVPASYVDAVDAGVVFEATAYVTTPAEAGSGIDLDQLTAAITTALADGGNALEYSGSPAEAPAAVSDEEAAATADSLNAMLGKIGFYVGEERTVPVAPAVAGTWLSVVDENGELRISADEDAIQAVVDTLPGLVNRAPVDARVVVNSSGDVLSELNAGVSGREVGDVTDAASRFADQLESGDAVFALDVSETAFETTTLLRRIDVDLGAQHAYLYENDVLVNSWAISSGLSATPTPTGNFAVFAHTEFQDMGCFEGASYCTEDVPWNTWFAPDIAFHGAYWHNNFGQQMSHGCVNMPVDVAKFVYDWAPVGTAVAVHW